MGYSRLMGRRTSDSAHDDKCTILSCSLDADPKTARTSRVPWSRKVGGQSSASVTKTDADRLCLLPHRPFGPFHRLGDLRDRRSCLRMRLEFANVFLGPWIARLGFLFRDGSALLCQSNHHRFAASLEREQKCRSVPASLGDARLAPKLTQAAPNRVAYPLNGRGADSQDHPHRHGRVLCVRRTAGQSYSQRQTSRGRLAVGFREVGGHAFDFFDPFRRSR